MIKLKTNLQPAALSQVTVTDGYCKNALEKEVSYLLSLQEGRLLAGFCENAGLKTPFVRYGGWESGLMGGHTLGHYLTAVSQGAVNPAVPEPDRKKLFNKMKNIIDCLAECQKAAPIGLVWGAPPVAGGIEAQFDHVERGETDIYTQAWVPWYTLHKILAGLVEAYKCTGYAPALSVAEKLGDWVYERASSWDERTHKTVLETEYGGMNDALYELYSLTEKPAHAVAAHLFDEEELFDRVLSMEPNVLDDLHANTTIPKFLGALNRYLTLHGGELCGEKVDASRYLHAAECFFQTVTTHHTYATGGNSEWERFGKDDVLDKERTNCNCETCNVYNMLKLARGLFLATGRKEYCDYYDNAFTNQILSSQNPETGMTTYFQAMASGYFKVFSSPEQNFWCCTGTGMENFTKLGDGIYYRNGKSLFVERYLSSVYEGEDVALLQSADLPFGEGATFKVLRAKEPFLLCLRLPEWAAGYPEATKNGAPVKLLEGSGHVTVAVKEGDEITLKIPVEMGMKGLPDGENAFAFRFGGVLLSADLGSDDMRTETTGENVTIPSGEPCEVTVKVNDLYALFEEPTKFFVREGEIFVMKSEPPLKFSPHFKRYKERYAIYVRVKE